ncbi:hypothetical protein HAX54_033359 [Datura stramonium]|uniref:Ubiquitin-like protease family profile domain-containing protein n=1 Tax=Datura stramonium TaxID=4076 RepID=A0ABS8VEG4_DATST|nr:hypothetical protein [Datura stramonium]
MVPTFTKKHPFEENSIYEPYDMNLIEEYLEWIRDGLLARHQQKKNNEDCFRKNKSKLAILLNFGVDTKCKYNPVNTYKYTIVDCLFTTRIAWIWDKYGEVDSASSATKEEDIVCEYINGYRLYVVVPWNTVDNVFIPINVKDKLHWVLAVLSFRDRCIYIYDSLRSAGHDVAVKSEIEKLSQLLPIYLSTTDFYKKKGITSSTHPRDCSIFVAAYAEFLSGGEGIPNSSIDAELMHNRYASILWDYATKKLEAESMSDDEAPPKKIRSVVESSNNYRIVLS